MFARIALAAFPFASAAGSAVRLDGEDAEVAYADASMRAGSATLEYRY